MYSRYGNYVSMSFKILFLCCSANTEGMAQSIDSSLHFLKCGAKKALGQLVLLD